MHTQLDSENLDEKRRLAAAMRSACVQAALNGYQDARMDGLCHEGAWECAIDAMRSLDLKTIMESHIKKEETLARS